MEKNKSNVAGSIIEHISEELKEASQKAKKQFDNMKDIIVKQKSEFTNSEKTPSNSETPKIDNQIDNLEIKQADKHNKLKTPIVNKPKEQIIENKIEPNAPSNSLDLHSKK